MYRGRRIVAFTPYGRERTVSILLPYLRREHDAGILDEWMLCMNTDPEQTGDRKYADTICSENKWARQYHRPGPDLRFDRMPKRWSQGYEYPKQLNTGRFFWYMQDRNAVYLRFDDDIVYVHPDAIRAMADSVIDHDDRLGTFPLIINNAVCSSILQAKGKIPMEWGHVQPNAVDPIGWGSAQFAVQLHNKVLYLIEEGNIDQMLLPTFATALGWRQQFSVSCFAISGKEYAELGGVIDWPEEEHWLTMHRTGIVKRSNYVTGDALVVHFSFFTQKAHLARTNLLDRYRTLSEAL